MEHVNAQNKGKTRQERLLEQEGKFRGELILSAKRWLNVRELTGNNDHPMITKAMKICGLRGDLKYPWCAAAQAEIWDHISEQAPRSARVVDWFKANVIWKQEWGDSPFPIRPGMEGGFYFPKLGRYAHIGMIVGEDKNNYYMYEGNTSPWGQFEPDTFERVNESSEVITREAKNGGGFYAKIRSKKSIAIIADYVLLGNAFVHRYDKYLQSVSRYKK